MTNVIAHGLGGRTDLPLPAWLFGYGAGAALLISFAALVVFWPTARLAGPATSTSVDEDPEGSVVAGCFGVALLAGVVAAALLGDPSPTANLAPVTIYVIFWVGITILSAVLGDVWYRGIDPYPLLARAVQPREGSARPYRWGHWPAAAGLLAFVWVELVLPSRAEPRVLAVLIVVYSAVVLIAAAFYGRPAVSEGDPFAAWFTLVAAMAPLGRTKRRIGFRAPIVGLAAVRPRRGTAALVLVALGSTAFDGITRSAFWASVVGTRSADEVVPLATFGLSATIAVVGALYVIAMSMAAASTGRDAEELANAFIHSLVPIAFAYAVAHYFSLLVLEGQGALSAISDPFGQGWDLFGTIGRPIDYTWVSPNATAYVQVGIIVIGHIAGVILAHDRALALFPKKVATRSQYPLLVMMVLFTVGGLGLLLGG